MESPHKHKIMAIGVLCGSTMGKGLGFSSTASELGKAIALRGVRLVYGGGSMGLKGYLAASALAAGGQVLGIIPKFIAERNLSGPTLGEEIRVTTIYNKIGYMIYQVDAFIALPGGLDTLEELFCIASWSTISDHKKPIGLLNVDGFFDSFISFLDHAVEQGILPQAHRNFFVTAMTVDKLLDRLQARIHVPLERSNSDSTVNQLRPISLELSL